MKRNVIVVLLFLLFTFSLVFAQSIDFSIDNYPSEGSYTLTGATNGEIASGGWSSNYETITVPLPGEDTYTVVLTDQYSDGGATFVVDPGTMFGSGDLSGAVGYNSSMSFDFVLSATPPPPPPAVDLPWSENFDEEWPPTGMTIINNDSDSYTWSQSSQYISPTHSPSYAAHGMGSNDDYLISPNLNTENPAILKWWDRVESASYLNTYDVLISTTDAEIASFTDNLGTYNCTNNSWEEYEIDLTAYAGQSIYIAFHQTYSASNWYGFGIDDVSVEDIPTVPIFAISPEVKDFGSVDLGTIGTEQIFTISNAGSGLLTIATPISLTGTNAGDFILNDTNSYPIDLLTGEEAFVGVACAPTEEGDLTANLHIEDNITSRNVNEIPLMGAGLDLLISTNVGFGSLTGQYLPMKTNYGYSYSQCIYKQPEINAGGEITGIIYYSTSSSGYGPDDITIYMGHTAKTQFDTTSDWIPESELIEVYSGPITVPAGSDGRVIIQLDTPFVYNNSDNLFIAFDENTSGWHSYTDDFYCSATDEARGIVYYNDYTNVDPASPSSGYLKNAIANVTLIGIVPPSGFISGIVRETDYRGAVIEGATVYAENSNYGTFEADTDANGEYTIKVSTLESGSVEYNVYAIADGFNNPEPLNVSVSTDLTTADVDFDLVMYLPEPLNLVLTSGDGNVDLQWEMPVERAFLGTYNVYRGTSADALSLIASDLGDLTYSDAVENEMTYFYAVTSNYDNGPLESPFSNIEEATPQYTRDTPYLETFEENNGSFSGTGDWHWMDLSERSPEMAASGTHVWGTSTDGAYASYTDMWLYTTPFDLSGMDEAVLSLSYWKDISSSGSANVYVDWDNSGEMVYLSSLPNNSAAWENLFISIPIPEGVDASYVRFGIKMYSYYSSSYEGLFIDDVKVHAPVQTAIFSTKTINLGEYQVGQLGQETITITNPANAPAALEIYSINSSNPHFTMTSSSRTDYIAAGESMDYEVSFIPTEITNYEAYFTITSNDPYSLPPFGNGLIINASGIGIEQTPVAQINRSNRVMNVGFGFESSYTYDIEVSNDGMAPLEVAASIPVIPVSSRVDINITPASMVIAPGTTEIFTLEYIPTVDAFTREECQVAFITNDEDLTEFELDFDINIVGTYGTEPDDFGYLCRNSLHEDGPTYVWRDVTDNVLTSVDFTSADDGYIQDLSIGFDFTFYGEVYSEFNLNANGLLYFEDYIRDFDDQVYDTDENGSRKPRSGRPWYTNVSIPNSTAPNGMIAFFWDDLHMGYSAYNTKIYYGNDGDGSLVVTYENMPPYQATGEQGAMTFQIVLTPGGDILIQYKDVDWTKWTDAKQTSATIGIESPDGLNGSQYSYNQASIFSELALRYYTPWNDTATLPSEIRFDEDNTFLLDILNYMPSGGQLLDIEIVTAPAHCAVEVLNNQFFSFVPDENWNGSDAIGYNITLADARGEITRSSGTMSIMVDPVNDMPEIIGTVEDVILAEDFGTSSISIDNLFEDIDSELLLSLSLSDNSKVDAEIVGTDLVFTSVQDMFTDVPVEVTLTATELGREINLSASKSLISNSSTTTRDRAEVEIMFLLTITPVNDVPVVQNAVADFSIIEDGSAELDLLNIFYDPDGDDITLGFEQIADSHLNVLLDGSMLIITPEANWNGQEAIVITCDDGVETVLASSRRQTMNTSRDVATDDFMVTVTPVNDAPMIVAPIADFSFDEDTVDTSIDLNLVFADYDLVYGDQINFTVSGANNLTVDLAAGIVTLTPALNWNGIEVLTFKATDLSGAFVNETVQIVVNPVNDVPTIELPGRISFNEGTMLTRNFGQFINDVDGDELTLTVSGNTEVVVGITGLTVVFSSADPIYYGSEVLTFTVDDGSSELARATATDDIEIVVNYVNEAPVYVGPTYIGMPDIYEDFSDDIGTYTIGTLTDLFTDQEIAAGYDWTNFTFEIVSFNSAKIDAYIEDGDLKITSVPNAFGLSTLRVKASDNDQYSAGTRAALSFTQNIEIYLESVNDLPYFVDLQTDIAMAANSIQYIYFEANIMDVDDPTPVLEITSPEGFVTITKLAGYNYRFKFDALGLFDMLETIDLVLDDGNGGIAEAQIAVSIAASEPPYTTYLIPVQEFDEDFENTEIIDLTTCFADPDDAVLNYSVSVNTVVGGVPVIEAMIDADNILWIGSSLENWYGEAEVLVNCWDNLDRYTITQNVGVVVNAVNDIPTVAGQIADQDLQEDFVGFQVADLTTVFNDVDGDLLGYQLSVSEAGIVNPMINGNMLELYPIADMYGSVIVTIGVTDYHHSEWVETEFIVTISDVMDYPTFMGGLEGSVFEFNMAGEVLDLTPYVNTHNQVNTAPISYVFTPLPGIPEPCYEITQNPYPLYGFTVTPVGYQPNNWHVTYPDQECTLILEGGDQIVVTFTTNLSPYVLATIPDMLLTQPGRDGIDLDSYFADPIDLPLSYNVIYETDVLGISLEGSMMYINDIYNSDVTNVTVVASNSENRSTCAQTFQVVTMNGINFDLLVVDQDHSSVFNYDDVAEKVTGTLAELGINYTTFVYEGEDNGPSAETLALYNMVLWFTGDACEAFETMSETDMTNIAAFIDNGGWFYLNSQDIIYDIYTQREEMEGERVHAQEIFIPEGDFAYDYLGLREVYQDYWGDNFRTIGAEGIFLEGFYADIDGIDVPLRHGGDRNEIYADYLVEHAGMDLMVADLELDRTYGTNSIMYGTTTFSTVPFLGYSDEDLVEYFAYIFAYYNGMYIPPVRGGEVAEDSNEAPVVTALKGNYPNPFNPTTNIMFALQEETNVEVEIFNIKGQKVRTLVNETMTSGDHSVVWNGMNDKGDVCGSGVYFYKLKAAHTTDIKKMLMVK